MPQYIALLRGINVGRAKFVAMTTLADVFREHGCDDVRTVLRSGNVVMCTANALGATASARLEAGILRATGVQSSVLLLDASRFVDIARQNPLEDSLAGSLEGTLDGSKMFVTFVESMPEHLELPDVTPLAPEVLAVGPNAVYQWMPQGSQQTKVPHSFWRQFPTPVTARNWNTVQKLIAQLH